MWNKWTTISQDKQCPHVRTYVSALTLDAERNGDLDVCDTVEDVDVVPATVLVLCLLDLDRGEAPSRRDASLKNAIR